MIFNVVKNFKELCVIYNECNKVNSDDLKSLNYILGGFTMKKEDLVALGLDDTQIKEVFKMRGIEIEKTKQTIADLENEKAEAERKLAEAIENTISAEDFEAVKNEKLELEQKITEMTQAHQSEINEIKFNVALEKELTKAGAKDINLVKTVIDTEKIKFEDGKIEGLTEQLESAKENYDYLFSKESKGLSNITTKHSGGGGGNKITIEDFKNMTYTEKNELYNKNPGLYKSLTQR